MERTVFHDKRPSWGDFVAEVSKRRLGVVLLVAMGVGLIIGALLGGLGATRSAIYLGAGTAFVVLGVILVLTRAAVQVRAIRLAQPRLAQVLRSDMQMLQSDLARAKLVTERDQHLDEVAQEIEIVRVEMLRVADDLFHERSAQSDSPASASTADSVQRRQERRRQERRRASR